MPSVLHADEASDNLDISANLNLKIHEWDRAVRGFRRDHHFALLTGIAQETWHLQEFGQATPGTKIPMTAYTGRLQYTFHIPFMGGFGYYLGSSVGTRTGDKKDSTHLFQRPKSVGFPGVVLGLAYDINPAVCFLTGIDAYLDRIENINFEGAFSDPSTKVAATGRVFSYHAAADFFFRLNWALRLTFEEDTLYLKAAGDVNVKRNSHQVGVGLIYHLL